MMQMSTHKWYVHLIDDYREEKMKELQSYTSAWMNLKPLLVGEKAIHREIDMHIIMYNKFLSDKYLTVFI